MILPVIELEGDILGIAKRDNVRWVLLVILHPIGKEIVIIRILLLIKFKMPIKIH